MISHGKTRTSEAVLEGRGLNPAMIGHAIFSGNSSQLRTHLKGMGVEEEKLYDYLQNP
jgi:hypothetical protein